MLQTLFSIFAASTALTTSYQSKTLEVGGFTELVLYLKHTTGDSETSAALVLKIEFSPDGTNFYQVPDSNNAPATYSYPGGAGSTAYSIRVPIAIADKFIKISVKDSGVSTNHGTLQAQAFATESPQAFGLGQSTAGGSSGDTQTAGADAESNAISSQYVSARMQGFNGTTWDRIKAGITTVTSTLTGWLNTLPWAVYHTTPSARTDGQGGPLEAGTSGQLLVDLYSALNALVGGVETDNIGVVPFRRADAFHAQFNGTCSTSVQAVKTATASKKHYITDLHISTDTAGWYSIVDGATTVLLGPYYMPANSVLPVKFATPVPGSTNTALNVDCSGSSGNVTVIIEGYTI